MKVLLAKVSVKAAAWSEHRTPKELELVDRWAHGLLGRCQAQAFFAKKSDPKSESEKLFWVRPSGGPFEALFIATADDTFPWKNLQKLLPPESELSWWGDFSEAELRAGRKLFSSLPDEPARLEAGAALASFGEDLRRARPA